MFVLSRFFSFLCIVTGDCNVRENDDKNTIYNLYFALGNFLVLLSRRSVFVAVEAGKINCGNHMFLRSSCIFFLVFRSQNFPLLTPQPLKEIESRNYICITSFINRQTVLLNHNSSVCLNTRNVSS